MLSQPRKKTKENLKTIFLPMVVFILSLQESYRFIGQATAILKAVGNVINNFSSKPELSKALKELELTHCPPGLHGTGMAEEHFKVNKQF